ncbi:MAG TPA: hypothetical protein VFG53_04255 [Anaeromyxobacter sp.]|nr:hypothetical protein [Anaeromyxobacter sp.]
MTPQSSITVAAPIAPGRVPELRALLATMNDVPGRANPSNPLLPFGDFERLHFARLLVLDDQTLGDLAAYGQVLVEAPTYLALLFDCDGPAEAQLEELAARAGAGLRQIFGHCQGFDDQGDLVGYLKAHRLPEAATYVNWIGRTTRQIREEAALRRALRGYLDAQADSLGPPEDTRRALRAFADGELRAGRLRLTPEEPTPLGHRLREVAHLVGVPLAGLILLPLLLVYLPFFALELRRRESHDPEIAPRPDPEHVKRLDVLEDHSLTNQFSAMGTIKPGLFRRLLLDAALLVLDYSTRHLYARGHLARVGTIHFARWAFLPGRRRLLFASNYDGSLDSYMDDFINKVAFGLNLVFSNGVGYPSTRWLVLGGARDEQKFKYYIRRHELPTEVWYDAHPGLTAVELRRNAAVRAGLAAAALSDPAAAAWLALI